VYVHHDIAAFDAFDAFDGTVDYVHHDAATAD
jgi:hypothetical protein